MLTLIFEQNSLLFRSVCNIEENCNDKMHHFDIPILTLIYQYSKNIV